MSQGRLLLAVALGALATPARADDDAFLIRSGDLSLTKQPHEVQAPPSPSSRFGEAGSRWWTVGGGVANDFRQATDVNLRGAYSYFLIDNVEFSFELNGWYFDQPGKDAFGINPAIVFRWHFYNQDPVSVYADLGIGLLFTDNDVPAGGTDFDFTPRAGVGFTRRITDDGTRLQAGLRWHHVSNGRIYGDTSNPGRDALMLYAGVQWPF